MPGKVRPNDLLEYVFGRTGGDDETVLQGPAYGEDAAAIDWPGGTLVVSSDPISLAASRVGVLGVYVACNDVAASGADPRWLTVVVMLPTEGTDREPAHASDADDEGETDPLLEEITADLDATARDVGATIVGGHSEYVDALDRPLLSLTAMGATERFVPTGGAQPGDRVILTKAAGIEGTAVLASDFGADLEVVDAVCDRATSFFEEVSVAPEARIVREYASAMHDPTEGGVAAGLLEIARASAVRLEIRRERVPIREETRTLCAAVDVDPLRIFGSGALLATVPEDDCRACLEALWDAEIDAAEIGVVREESATGAESGTGPGTLTVDDEPLEGPIEDDLYPLWADDD